MSACYQCNAPATGACTRCGKLYCAVHGNKTAGDGFLTIAQQGLCDECHASLSPRKMVAAWVGVLAILAVLAILFIATAMRR